MSEQYRQELRVAAKLMLWVALAVVVYVFVKGMFTGGDNSANVPTMVVEIAHWEPGDTQSINWSGRPVIIHRRTEQERLALEQLNEHLLHPAEQHSVDEWSVVIALGADFTCSIEYLPPSEEEFAGVVWQGGYADVCRGDRYDGAGRVYKGQNASEDLLIPDFRVRETRLILGAQ